MSWLAARPLAALGALAGALVGAAVAVAVLLDLPRLAGVDPPRPIGVVVVGLVIGTLCGRLAVSSVERDLRHLAGRVFRHGRATEIEPLHRETADIARAIDMLTAREAAADTARSEAMSQLETVVDGLRDGVLVVDVDLTTLSLNRAAADLLDVSRSSSVGQSLVVVTRDADIVRVVREAVEGRPVQALPIDYRRSGRQLTVQVQLVRGRRRTLAIVVLQDVTEIRRLERVRRDFVANVSHELRTPLASIRALAETLEAGAMHDAEAGPDFLGRIVVEVDRMTWLVDGLIDLGRLQAGRMGLNREPTELASLLDDAVSRIRPLVAETQVSAAVELPESLPPLDLDRARIDQVLTNLLHNAVKFTPPGGKIVVRARRREDTIAIEVSDTGVGIAPDEVERVFERFYKSDQSRQSSGTGLGLAIAKHIVLAHGGSIGVSSKLGAGSTFTVELPLKS